MENPFIERCEILKSIDSKFYNADNLITELLLYLNKLNYNLCPSFKDIFCNFENECYNISRKYKYIFAKQIKHNNYDENNVYHEDKEKIIFVFDIGDLFACYILKKQTNQVIIDKAIINYILCDLIEECIENIAE